MLIEVYISGQCIRQPGVGTLLAKLDLREAYRMVPVHPQDRLFLGMQWRGKVYIDTTLPFSLHLAPKIFSAIPDGLVWVIHAKGFTHTLHYLDDFLLLGPADTSCCTESLCTTISLCKELGVPIAEEKTEGPASSITFLGIEINTVSQQLRLPQSILLELKSLLADT